MKSYEEAVKYGKRSMEYANSRAGLKILKVVVTSGIAKVNDKRRTSLLSRGTTLFNLYEGPDKASSTVNIFHALTALLKEIEISLQGMDKKKGDVSAASLHVDVDDSVPEVKLNSPLATGRSLLRRNTKSTARLDNFQLSVSTEVEVRPRSKFCSLF